MRRNGRFPTHYLSTVIKASQVLDCVVNSNGPEGTSAVEIAAQLELQRATVHRLLKTLKFVGLIHQTPKVRYFPGPVLLGYGLALGRRSPWTQTVRPVLEWLVGQTGETVTFSLLLPNQTRMIVAQLESPQTVRWVAQIGATSALYAGASGKAMLAAMADAEREKYLAETSLEPITAATITDPQLLRTELAKIREQGYAISRGERSSDSGAVAVAVVSRPTGVVGALSICGPVFRMAPSVFPRYGSLVRAGGHRLSLLMEPSTRPENFTGVHSHTPSNS